MLLCKFCSAGLFTFGYCCLCFGLGFSLGISVGYGLSRDFSLVWRISIVVWLAWLFVVCLLVLFC